MTVITVNSDPKINSIMDIIISIVILGLLPTAISATKRSPPFLRRQNTKSKTYDQLLNLVLAELQNPRSNIFTITSERKQK